MVHYFASCLAPLFLGGGNLCVAVISLRKKKTYCTLYVYIDDPLLSLSWLCSLMTCLGATVTKEARPLPLLVHSYLSLSSPLLSCFGATKEAKSYKP